MKWLLTKLKNGNYTIERVGTRDIWYSWDLYNGENRLEGYTWLVNAKNQVGGVWQNVEYMSEPVLGSDLQSAFCYYYIIIRTTNWNLCIRFVASMNWSVADIPIGTKFIANYRTLKQAKEAAELFNYNYRLNMANPNILFDDQWT